MSVATSAVAVFLAAALSFLVQPLIGRHLLPLAGGSPVVWNTCLVFFQAVLLLGYLYAHRLTRLRVSRQLMAHAALVAGGLLALSVNGLSPDPNLIPAESDYPVVGLLAALAVAVGGPAFVLSATAPLVQHWFAVGGGRNPYPLYAASNAGSLLGLVAYPFVVEPLLPLGEQRLAWAGGFVGAVLFVLLCGLIAAQRAVVPVVRPAGKPVSFIRGLGWMGCAALPSSMLMSATTTLTTDVAPVPLLWVLPLALYLVTFIVAFGGWPASAQRTLGRIVPVALCALTLALLTRATEPLLVVAGIHLGALVLVALLCHGELAADRPDASQLTTFYLWVSAGGVLGGLLTAVFAPVGFATFGMVEYPFVVILAAGLRPQSDYPTPHLKRSDFVYAAGVAALTLTLVLTVPLVLGPPSDDPAAFLDRAVRGGLMFGLPLVVSFALVWRPKRFQMCILAVLLIGLLTPGPHGRTLEIARNGFGTLRVTKTADGYIDLVHGTTRHGRQKIDEPGRPEPRMYYHKKGPLGRLFAHIPAERRHRVGVVGLGCGATAAYASAGEAWTFYEIDPGVVRLAKDERYFTFLSTCPANPDIVLGDARRQLVHAKPGEFDLLVLDAFSSDAIPVHLLTREAFELYDAKLGPRGVLALHLSNRYLDLPPLVARLAHERGLVCRQDEDMAVSDGERADGKAASCWVFVARRAEDITVRASLPLEAKPGPVWTDDFSNLLSVWKAGE